MLGVAGFLLGVPSLLLRVQGLALGVIVLGVADFLRGVGAAANLRPMGAYGKWRGMQWVHHVLQRGLLVMPGMVMHSCVHVVRLVGVADPSEPAQEDTWHTGREQETLALVRCVVLGSIVQHSSCTRKRSRSVLAHPEEPAPGGCMAPPADGPVRKHGDQ